MKKRWSIKRMTKVRVSNIGNDNGKKNNKWLTTN